MTVGEFVIIELFRFIFILGYVAFCSLLGGVCGYFFRKYRKNKVKKEDDSNEESNE